MNTLNYAGFWVRFGASVVDSILVLVIVAPLVTMVYGSEYWSSSSLIKGPWDVLLNYVLPTLAIITFWVYKSATPGKMVFKLVILDAKTGLKPTTGQLIGRYFAYYVSIIPLMLGFMWVGIDKHKQGWHDKLAGTVVVKN